MDARTLYKKFRGRYPTREGTVTIAPPKELVMIGPVTAIEYDTSMGGETKKFRHDFLTGSRPLLCVGTKKGQLFLVGDRNIFTERGIVDLDSKGRERE